MPFVSRILGIVIIIAVAALVRFVTTNHGNGSLSQQIQSQISDTSPKPFTSTAYGFQINFPGFPTIDNENVPVESHNVPLTLYEKDLNNGNSVYLAAGYDFSAFPDLSQNPNGVLEGALNGSVGSIKTESDVASANITSSSFNQFAGLPGLGATLSVATKDGSSYTAYYQVFLKGQKMYLICTIGTSQDEFNTFLSSFSFV